jgi:hypothetical protein
MNTFGANSTAVDFLSFCGTQPTCSFELSLLCHLCRYSTQCYDWSAVWFRWQWIVKRSLGDIHAVQFDFLCAVWPTSSPVPKQILLLFSDPSHPQILCRVAMNHVILNNGYLSGQTVDGEVQCPVSFHSQYTNLNYQSKGSFSLPAADIRGIIVDGPALRR